MKVSNQKPPNWERLVKLFDTDWNTIAVTYGDTVYASRPISPDLEVHEATHARQQAEHPAGVEGWWAQYYVDTDFRFKQEVEAYREQFKFFKRFHKDRNFVFRFRDKIARDLSGKLYGHCVKFDDAFELIGKNGA